MDAQDNKQRMHVGFHVNKTHGCGFGAGNTTTSDTTNDTSKCTLALACQHASGEIREYISDACVQVFITGPQSGKPLDVDGMSKLDVRVYVHGSYVDNPWSERTHILRNELRIADGIGAHGVVVHLGAKASIRKLDKVFNGLSLTMPKPYIWLEINSAKAGAGTFETPEKLAALFSDGDDDRVGLCIDTAHLFACGINLGSREAAETWLRSLQWALPRVHKLVHLNDTSAELGSGRDVHENLFHGNLWGAYKKRKHTSGVAAIVEWCQRHGYDIIVERSSRDSMLDIRVLSELL